MKTKFYFILFVTILGMLALNSNGQFYKPGDKGKFIKGELSEADYTSLKSILLENSKSVLQDTLIIKYEYNNETCWMFLDKLNDDEIASSIKIRQLQIQKACLVRKGISVFKFREKGLDLNKVVERDSSILIDRKKQLFRLLFKKRATCGNSIIVLPNRKFILIRSDSHFEAINYTQDQISDVLAN